MIILGIIFTILGGTLLTCNIYNLSQYPDNGSEVRGHKTTIIKAMIAWFLVTASGMYIIGYQIFNNLNL